MALSLFRRKPKEEVKGAQAQPSPDKTLIEELCGSDKELCDASSILLLMNPELVVREGVDSFAAKAQEYERAKDTLKARIAYQVAGGIALYEGKLSQAQSLFKKAAEIDPSYSFRRVFDYINKKENAERVLAVAQKYYSRMDKQPTRLTTIT